jgi:predicted transcriptional regulator
MTKLKNGPTWDKPGRGRSLAALGFLEADILAVVWGLEKATVRDVYEIMLTRRKIAYTTVMSVMRNLTGKGLLAQDQTRITYLYSPAVPRREVIGSVTDSLIASLCGGERGTVLAHLLDLPASLSTDQVARLKQLAQGLD